MLRTKEDEKEGVKFALNIHKQSSEQETNEKTLLWGSERPQKGLINQLKVQRSDSQTLCAEDYQLSDYSNSALDTSTKFCQHLIYDAQKGLFLCQWTQKQFQTQQINVQRKCVGTHTPKQPAPRESLSQNTQKLPNYSHKLQSVVIWDFGEWKRQGYEMVLEGLKKYSQTLDSQERKLSASATVKAGVSRTNGKVQPQLSAKSPRRVTTPQNVIVFGSGQKPIPGNSSTGGIGGGFSANVASYSSMFQSRKKGQLQNQYFNGFIIARDTLGTERICAANSRPRVQSKLASLKISGIFQTFLDDAKPRSQNRSHQSCHDNRASLAKQMNPLMRSHSACANTLSTLQKLPCKIIYSSGEDPQFPLSELEVNTPQSRGWASAKFCEYPQELILQFTPATGQPFVKIKEVQIITHQSKIPSKVELQAFMPGNYESLQRELKHIF